MRHLDRARQLALAARDTSRLARVFIRRGAIKQLRGDHNAALSDFYDGLRLYEAVADQKGLASAYNSIGAIHHYDKNYVQAQSYYALSLGIQDRIGTPSERALLYNNFGALLEDRGLPDSALVFHRRSLAIRQAQKDTGWVAVVYANIGSCHDKQDRGDSARWYLRRSLALIASKPHGYLYGSICTRLGLSYLHSRDQRAAIDWCEKGLAVADELVLPRLVQQSCECLYQTYRDIGDAPRALIMLQRFMAVRDSVFGEERAKELTRIELTYNFERQNLADSLKRLEERRLADKVYLERIGRERDQKRVFLFGAIAVLLIAGGLWSRLIYMRRSRNAIARERERSDKLLLNILPGAIAEELKQYGEARARDVAGVSILFTDFADFTPLSERMSAQELVAEINTCFKAFDAITTAHGLEKIKTIGDAYMAAGGLPEQRSGSALDTVMAALEMQEFLRRHATERSAKGATAFTMRAGIHTGPVVAGIVGDTKFQYDVWGDTVNMAARTESSGMAGEVNISHSTYREVEGTPGLRFVKRGMVEVKGKGAMEMYFVQRSSAEGTRNEHTAQAE